MKDAILDNDFLKKLDSAQIREVVECMYEKQVKQGHYIIREGDAGQHLYVAAGTPLVITITRLCSILPFFIDVKSTIFRLNILIFSYFCPKHRSWVHVRTASLLTSTHDLCFRATMRKMYSPVNPDFNV